MEEAIEKFAIFGGVGWGPLNTKVSTLELIEEFVLSDFKFIRSDVTEVTEGLPLYHTILSGIAQGDGQTHTAFKRAKVSAEVGQKAVDELVERGMIKVKKPKKLYFNSPFLRFWFAFVSPIFKGIRDGEYSEFRELFTNRYREFLHLPFVQLSHELLKKSFTEDRFVEIGEHVHEGITFDIYAKTKSGKRVVGICKYTNSKLKKSELTRLEEMCQEAKIQADIFVLVAKEGFSQELKSLKGDSLKLFTLKNFKQLVE
ncbi:MAG: hypothetical protein JXQ67_00715 [Campylobacterales bacterium]|nr:hypothetical protein [Campylobacterales bacterium]